MTKREELDMEEIKYMLVNLSISEEERTDLIGKEVSWLFLEVKPRLVY